jgi:hypothetical protein
MRARNIVALSAALEALTGLVAIIVPAVLVQLLLASPLPAPGSVIARLAGFALIGLGVACWPRPSQASPARPAVCGLLTYNALVAIFFLYIGVRGMIVGPLFWPVVIVHAIIAILLARALFYQE